MVRDAGLQPGIVTNGYWATSPEDAEQWLRPMLDLGIADFSVSDDEFHSSKGDASPGAIAYRAATQTRPSVREDFHRIAEVPAVV